MDRNIEAYPSKAGYIAIRNTLYKVDNIRSYAKYHFRGEDDYRGHITIPEIVTIKDFYGNMQLTAKDTLSYPYPDLFKE